MNILDKKIEQGRQAEEIRQLLMEVRAYLWIAKKTNWENDKFCSRITEILEVK